MSFKLKDSEQVRALISYSGKSQRTFAESINVSHSYLSQILNDKRNVSPAMALKIADGVGETIESIFLLV